jgi:4-hydroxy-4-methyl-2-oxoglutarate aldolase
VNDLDTLERLGRLDACSLADALDSLGLPGVALGLERRSTRERIAGFARTVKLAAGPAPCGPAVHLGARSIAASGEADVIVVEQRTGIDAAAWGGLLSHAARLKRIRGVIVDGPVRDIDEFQEVGLPVFSRSVTPLTARGRIHESGFDVPIVIDGVAVERGDFVVADGSGVVFIAAGKAQEVLLRAEDIAAREAGMVDALHAGQSVTEVMGRDYEIQLGDRQGLPASTAKQ